MSNPSNESWATPAPAGLTALAVVILAFAALFLGWIPPTTAPLIGCWCLGGALIQFAVAIMELKEGSTLGGNVFLYFSGFFMLSNGLELLIKTNALWKDFGITSQVDGFAWIVLSGTLVLWVPSYLHTANKVMGACATFCAVSTIFVTLRDLGLASASLCNTISGWAFVIAAALAVYLTTAIQWNKAWGRTVLPVGNTPWI